MGRTSTYTLTLPQELAESWPWFEARGYLPPMPGTILSEDATATHLGLTEAEAWDFQEECDLLGEGCFSCMADPSPILKLLDSIV